jgi:peptidoglycan/xylan/chitin deacetylase (PgdA/CDA1 family)
MRGVVVVFALLLTLGLAALSVVEARKVSLQSAAPAAPAAAIASRGIDPAPRSPAAPLTVAEVPAPVPPAAAPLAQPTPAAAEPPPARPVPAPTQIAQAKPTMAAAPAMGPAAAPSAIGACDKPNALGLARIVEIDTTGGPGFGFEHFKQYDFLRMNEVVLTFDDGPWPNNTPAVLKALADHCLKATFFPIGKHATYFPDILRQVAEAGHTIGNHTWGHKDLSKKPYDTDLEAAKEEIEMGVSAVHMAIEGPTAPFFRFPALKHPPELVKYLGERNIGMFSTDLDSFDFKMRKPEQVIKSVMDKLKKHGKGIVLMHDFQHATAEALPELLRQLKAGGYKIVHMKPKSPVVSLAKYEDMVRKTEKLPVNNTRPTSSVVKTISE